MRLLILIGLVFGLVACTTTADVQKQCAQTSRTFAAEVSCMENLTAQYPYMKNDSFVQEYLLSARVLADQQRAGKITENEARLQLARNYNRMVIEQQRLNTYNAMEWEALRPRDTDCYVRGNQVHCTSY